MLETPKFIQGVYAFHGEGLERPVPLQPMVRYTVPRDKRAQFIYLRAGNPSPELVYLLLNRDGKPMRYFPVAAKGAVHVPLAIVEDIAPESVIELAVGAPKDMHASVVVDLGLMEV
jgi:hypothetical protein